MGSTRAQPSRTCCSRREATRRLVGHSCRRRNRYLVIESQMAATTPTITQSTNEKMPIADSTVTDPLGHRVNQSHH